VLKDGDGSSPRAFIPIESSTCVMAGQWTHDVWYNNFIVCWERRDGSMRCLSDIRRKLRTRYTQNDLDQDGKLFWDHKINGNSMNYVEFANPTARVTANIAGLSY
jgi:hypothetical protein